MIMLQYVVYMYSHKYKQNDWKPMNLRTMVSLGWWKTGDLSSVMYSVFLFLTRRTYS